ncbi:hypothetical protein [Limimaricola pyoseonensis]|uniref:Uncharacterized protein n=1 Tax=Limimaricola pyoseonensis TaxID=521013 RepID=A0A1G7E6X8_9RHOB|nr:hypothetical protein [Limimaricola pyoseonensis]SDE59441.1 hypothetical protein SAMN04488567_2027 [Limimaricola pyoseonensis]
MITRIALLLALLAAPAAQAQGRTETLRVENRSGIVLVRLFASPVTDEYWRDDLLGEYVLPSGQSADVTIRNVGECLYDLLMMFEDGDVIAGQVDVCTATRYTIRP